MMVFAVWWAAYERRVREQKLRVEMMQAKKENAHFLQLVDQKKAIEGMEARKVREPLKYGASTRCGS